MDSIGVIEILVIFGVPVALGAVFGFPFGFVPSAIVQWLMTFVVGGGTFLIFASMLNEAQGVFVGLPTILFGFGFVAALWLTVWIRSYQKNRAR